MRARPRLRAGLTEAPGNGDADQVDDGEAKADRQACEQRGRPSACWWRPAARRRTGRDDHLRGKGTHRVDPNHGQGPEAVSPQTLEVTGNDRRRGEDAPEHESAGDAPPKNWAIQNSAASMSVIRRQARKPMITAGLI
jgi:hypothetical protein